MIYVLMVILGVFGGAMSAYAAFEVKRSRLRHESEKTQSLSLQVRADLEEIDRRKQELLQHSATLHANEMAIAERVEQAKLQSEVLSSRIKSDRESMLAEVASRRADALAQINEVRENANIERMTIIEVANRERDKLLAHVRLDASKVKAEREAMLEEIHRMRTESLMECRNAEERLTAHRRDLDQRIIKYDELQEENSILKHDLQNVDVNLRKLQLDVELQREKQEKLTANINDLGSRFLKDNVNWIGNSLTANNYQRSKERLQKVIAWCRGIDFPVSAEDEESLIADLKKAYEMEVRAALEREEQARIRARIREEQALQREVDRELKQLERERAAVQAALERALRDAKDQHSEEVDRLRARLTEAEARAQRAISQAQMTKAGHVYVISNMGTLGENIYKIGMTRRLEPLDRIRELGDASVPFPFDIHMMISSTNAPSLEIALHRALHKTRINKANPRKEYFRTDIETICKIVREHHGEIEYIADAPALEYRQSLAMSEEDQEYIESVFEATDPEEDEDTSIMDAA